jgi:hypothetical protein
VLALFARLWWHADTANHLSQIGQLEHFRRLRDAGLLTVMS